MFKSIGSFLFWIIDMRLLLENIDSINLKDFIKEFYSFAKQNLQINRIPKIILMKDIKNSEDMFGKTGYYNPETESIHLYISNRHPKDVLRSFAHELIHHEQKCNGIDDKVDLSLTANDPAYASHNAGLREMEREAFERGNMIFRDWCDMKKMERGNLMENKNLKKNKQEMDEAAKPDFLDLDGDGNREEPMKQAAKDAETSKGNKKGKKIGKKKNVKELAQAHAKKIINDKFGNKEEYLDSNVGEFKEKLEESKDIHPYPELFKKKERLFQERFGNHEEIVFAELMRRIIKKDK